MDELHDVIIAGAGPIGLCLACELGLAGVSVLVLERDSKPDSEWKAKPLGLRGLNTPSVEMFYRRGLLDNFFDLSKRPSSIQKSSAFQFAGHFAGISLDGNKLDLERWEYRLPGPALVPSPTTILQTETVLAARAESLGVRILRGHGVTKIVGEDHQSVTVQAGAGQLFRAKWLVGCDGGHSVVRKAASFDFVGTAPKFTGYAIQCDLDHPEKLKPGFNPTKSGMYVKGQSNSLHLIDFDGGAFDRKQKITKEHLQEVLAHVTGVTDLKITTVHLASSYTDMCRQVTSYRKGRILLAGDAAHIHSPLGAQGLNLGLGDAFNLGWKLAATIRQEVETDGVSANLALLDTYESERQPIGAWALEWTRAQVSMLQPDQFGAALQVLIRDLIKTTDGTNFFIDRFWGLSQRYKLGQGDEYEHPLVGCSAPDFELADGSRLGPKLKGGRGLLVDFEGVANLKDLILSGKYEGRVDYIALDAKDRRGICSLLVRPDGFVAWVAEESSHPDLAAVKAALHKWFEY